MTARKSPAEVSIGRRRAAWHAKKARGLIPADAPLPPELAPVGYAAPPSAPATASGSPGTDDSGGGSDTELPGYCPYDQAVQGRRITYNDALVRERAKGETIANEIKEIELARARGKMLSRDDVEKRDQVIDSIYMRFLGQVPDLLAQSAPPERQNQVRAEGRQWLKSACDDIAKAIEEAAGL